MSQEIFQKLKPLSILFIEDDEKIRDNVVVSLEMMFSSVYIAKDGFEAYNQYKNKNPDIILTDLAMEHYDGFSLIEKIREENLAIPIIILSAHSSKEFLIKAANLQIDGYIIKPVSLEKLLDKFSIAIKKLETNFVQNSKVQITNELSYDFNSNELFKNKELVKLGKKENQLLSLLTKNIGKTVTKEYIELTIWQGEATEAAFKNLISSLRKKIGKDLIKNIHGFGWKLDCQV